MRTLMFQQVHIKNPEEGRLFRVSQKLFEHYNPDADMLVIDNASPLDPRHFMSGCWSELTLDHERDVPKLPGERSLVRFKDAIGHAYNEDMATARDGGGRGMMKAIELGIENDYLRLGHVEADVLAVKPLPNLQPVACLPISQYGWRDWSVFVMMMPWAHENSVVARYNWDQPRNWMAFSAETLLTDICFGDLGIIPWQGARCEYRVTPERLRDNLMGHHLDWITHCTRDTFKEFLRIKCWPELAEEL